MPHKKDLTKKTKSNCQTVVVYPVVFFELNKKDKAKPKGKNKFGMQKRDRMPEKYSEPKSHFVMSAE